MDGVERMMKENGEQKTVVVSQGVPSPGNGVNVVLAFSVQTRFFTIQYNYNNNNNNNNNHRIHSTILPPPFFSAESALAIALAWAASNSAWDSVTAAPAPASLVETPASRDFKASRP